MAPLVTLIVLLLALVLVVFPIWALIRIIALGRQNDLLEQRLVDLQWQLRALREQPPVTPAPAAPPKPAPAAAPPVAAREVAAPPIAVAPVAPLAPPPPIISSPPPTPPVISTGDIPAFTPYTAAQPEPDPSAVPPILLPPEREREPELAAPRINWEYFMGAKGFAWAGGAAAFLGAVFFVKYSFEHDLIPPEVRVALGFIFATALIVGGLKMDRDRYRVLVETLCATGIVSLYAVTFACNSIYHFAFFGMLPTFLLMTLITATAFVLAVRLEARVVAVLGILGGFLTPILLSTGRDNPPGLFGYLALLNIGLIAVALHRRWSFLVALGTACTIGMQSGWADKFLTAAKAPTAMMVCLAFCALFLAAYVVARRLERDTTVYRWAAIAFPFVAFGFALVFFSYAVVAARPGLLFGFVLLADACLLAIAWLDEEASKLHLVAGGAVFALLAIWTSTRLTNELLPWALGLYLLHAVLHTGYPLLLERHRPDTSPTWWSQLFPPLALVLMFLPLFKLDAVSMLFWPSVLLIDLLAIGLALITGSLGAVAVVLVLTLAVTAAWILNVPVAVAADPSLLLVVGGFAILFFAAGLFLARRFSDPLVPATAWLGDARAQLPAFSALLPFLLLILMTQRLPLPDPSAIFGLALLLVILTCGLTVILCRGAVLPIRQAQGPEPAEGRRPEPESDEQRARQDHAPTTEEHAPSASVEWLPACALAGTVALELAWTARHRVIPDPTVPLKWFLIFHAVFSLFPFVFRRRFVAVTGPWAVAALAGVTQFPLVYRLVERTWPNDFLGLLAALFALPPLVSLVAILRSGRLPAPESAAAGEDAHAALRQVRLNQLAWFGVVGLLFITLIFPIQFDRQWLTLGWALEGTALLWLYHRVPHRGLRLTGTLLLVGAFVRLALNPAVFAYHSRTETPLLNWYLYSYGVVILCLLGGARLLSRPDPIDGRQPDTTAGVTAPALFNALAVVLAFILLNLEIADYFTPVGTRALTFQFSGNFARDMTYTIAWALFALGLLLLSIWRQTRAGRYAALGLLGVAVLKLFFHDLARLEALYRIGALFGVAIIAIVASFAYQRFLPGNEKDASEKP